MIKNPDENRRSPIKGQDNNEDEDKTQGGNLKHRKPHKGLTFKIKQEINKNKLDADMGKYRKHTKKCRIIKI